MCRISAVLDGSFNVLKKRGGHMKSWVLMLVFLATVTVLVGCETFKGAAKDVENTGDNIQDAVGNITK